MNTLLTLPACVWGEGGPHGIITHTLGTHCTWRLPRKQGDQAKIRFVFTACLTYLTYLPNLPYLNSYLALPSFLPSLPFHLSTVP